MRWGSACLWLRLLIKVGISAFSSNVHMPQNPEAHIRAFSESDTKAVVELWTACDLTRSWNHPEKDIFRKQKMQPELFLVGVQNGRIVASVMAGFDGHRGWINYLASHPDYQKQGWGRRIMEAVEAELRKFDCPKINLQLRISNSTAQAFYRRIGYTEDAALSFGKRLEFDSTASRNSGGSGTGGGLIRNEWRPGDLGAIVQMHGLLYGQELGFDATFELSIAAALAEFAQTRNPHNRIWIVEKEAQVRGSLALESVSEQAAQLRWLLLHPDHRRQGLGRKLVTEALEFAQSSGHESVFLWTVDALQPAARLYQLLGFRVAEERSATVGGQQVTEQRYALNF